MIEQLDTTKVGIKLYLDSAAETTGKSWNSQESFKLAVFRFIADTAKLDGELRQAAWKQFQATPAWFGTNASAGKQALEKAVKTDRTLGGYEA